LSGREFEEGDARSGDSPVILNATLERALSATKNTTFGQQIGLEVEGDGSLIVSKGVAADTRKRGLTRYPKPEYYVTDE